MSAAPSAVHLSKKRHPRRKSSGTVAAPSTADGRRTQNRPSLNVVASCTRRKFKGRLGGVGKWRNVCVSEGWIKKTFQTSSPHRPLVPSRKKAVVTPRP